MMSKKDQIKEIVFEVIKKIGDEEGIKSFQIPSLSTKIRTDLDSMAIVALSVDLEEKYEEVFNEEVRILNDENPDFLQNYETIETLINYINTI